SRSPVRPGARRGRTKATSGGGGVDGRRGGAVRSPPRSPDPGNPSSHGRRSGDAGRSGAIVLLPHLPRHPPGRARPAGGRGAAVVAATAFRRGLDPRGGRAASVDRRSGGGPHHRAAGG